MVNKIEIRANSYDENPPNRVWSNDLASHIIMVLKEEGFTLDERSINGDTGWVSVKMSSEEVL